MRQPLRADGSVASLTSAPRRLGLGRFACVVIMSLLLIGGLGLLGALRSATDSDTIFEDLATANQSSPIRCDADSMVSDKVNGDKVFLLHGKVWIEQGLVSVRVDEAVVWVDEESKRKTGSYQVEVYGEGSDSIPATLEQGSGPRKAAKIRLRFSTRGDVKFKCFRGPIQQANLAADPLFLRGDVGRGRWRAGEGAVIQASGRQPAIRMTSGEEPVLPPADVPKIPPLGDPAPADAGLSLPPVSMPEQKNPPLPPLGAPRTTNLPTVPDAPPALPTGPPLPLPTPPRTSLSPGPHGGSGVPQLVPQVPPTLPTQQPGQGATNPGMPREVEPPPDEAPTRQLFVRPRNSLPIQAVKYPLPNGEYAFVVSTPIIINVVSIKEKKVLLDIEADRMVMWGKENSGQDPLHNMRSPQGAAGKKMEFYLAGNVEIRNETAKEKQILRCQEAYYDVGRNVAIALQADMETKTLKLLNPSHFKAEELTQLGPKLTQGKRVEVFSTVLPADPGIKIELSEAQLERFDQPRKNIFGKTFIDMKTGQPVTTPESIITGNNAVVRLEGVPIWYFPKLNLDANDPLGPLDAITFGFNQIFGAQFFTTWNVFDLLGIVPDPGKKWQMFADYMTARGPALGTWYRDAGKNLFGITNQYEVNVKGYGIVDHGVDILGGPGLGRGQQAFTSPTTYVPVTPPEVRGRFLAQANVWDMDDGFSVQSQLALISDRNFLDQYFNNEWLTGLNQETFAYVKQQQNNWAWTVLGEERVRTWITETNWLPKLDGYLLGANFFDFLTYNTHASAGYAQLRPTDAQPADYIPTDVSRATGRLDWWHEVSAPFSLGDVKVAPYAIFDMTYYSSDIASNEVGRVYGGGGVRASVPFSKLFPDVKSELFNLNGIFHKVLLSANYYYAQTNVHYNQLPQLDQLSDDATNQALRNIFPVQSLYNPVNATNLTTNKLFDPQYFAIQRLVDNRVDTLDDIDVLQLDLRQRWQTKRGFAGSEHVVDWMVLDLQASIFPQPNRDNNSSQPFGILSYDWIWNIGDRTSLFSNGWEDPVSGGPRFFTFGTSINRPDRTNFTLAYRQIDPLLSKAVVASATLPLSAKYAITGSTLYDFGIHSQVNTLMLTRIGTDLRFSIGFSYNSILNNFNAVVEIVPNLMPGAGRGTGGTGGGMSGMGMGGGGSSSSR